MVPSPIALTPGGGAASSLAFLGSSRVYAKLLPRYNTNPNCPSNENFTCGGAIANHLMVALRLSSEPVQLDISNFSTRTRTSLIRSLKPITPVMVPSPIAFTPGGGAASSLAFLGSSRV
jgi:hypothetical protein